MTATIEPAPHLPAIDPARWPDVARVPAVPLRAPIGRALARHTFARLPIRVHGPDPGLRGGGGPDAPVLRLHRPDAFVRRLAADGLIGFGESYMAGDWDSPDLVRLLTAFGEAWATLIPRAFRPLRRVALPLQPRTERNTRAGARRNISRHYDLSNELFALFLDETMTYSSALFDGRPARDAAGLAAAQHAKIDRLLDGARVGPGTRLLEIGTGWGELAIRAARRGANVVSVTLSREQRALAVERAAAAGIEVLSPEAPAPAGGRSGRTGTVDLRLQDYRDVTGTYDAIVSVEMVEAVGERYWPVYFTALDRLTAPGGRVALQTITMDHARMRASRATYTWVHKYIFPGGIIPSVRAIEEQVADRTVLRVADRRAFGADYAETLRLWRERFDAAADDVDALGFDPVFRRMWHFYLAYSEAGFRSGLIDVEQLILERS